MGFVVPILPWWLELVLFLILAVLSFVLLFTPQPRPGHPSEDSFYDPRKKQDLPFPSLFDEGSVDLTFVLPAFNEELRLAKTLEDKLGFLEARAKKNPKFTYEIIVVSDGSKDKTKEVALRFSEQFGTEKVRLLDLYRNRGKGGAVVQGMMRARGRRIIFADADGATKVEDVEKLEKKMDEIEKNGLAVAVGSRHHLVKTDVVVKRSMIRNFLMFSFHLLVYVLGVKHINDTQCGFKLFSRKAAQLIFPVIHVEGWIFDIEVLLVAEKLRIPSAEVGVNWQEIPGSKMSLLRDSVRMLKDLLIIRLNYMLGFWTLTNHNEKRSSGALKKRN